jgi:hypothetical protein
MTKTRIWLIQSLVLLIVGVVLLVVLYGFFVPKITAYTNAVSAWSQNPSGNMPVPQAFGLDVSSMLVSGILGVAGAVLVFLGAVFLVILFVIKIITSYTVKISIGL